MEDPVDRRPQAGRPQDEADDVAVLEHAAVERPEKVAPQVDGRAQQWCAGRTRNDAPGASDGHAGC
jgi:hypothetical protein